MEDLEKVMDFLALISAKESTPGGSGALAILDEGEAATLSSLLAGYAHASSSMQLAQLEREGRQFLTQYRERERYAGVLDDQERSQLNGILDGRPVHPPKKAQVRPDFPSLKVAAAALAITATIAAGIGSAQFLRGQFESQQTGTSGKVQLPPPGQQVPLAPTDLQRTEQLLGPWRTIAPSAQRPQTASPAILLLTGGSTEASLKWKIPSSTSGWQPDQSGAVSQVVMHGSYAAITDADGTPYVVGTGQAFILASSPGVVFRVSPDGTPMSLPLAQAVASRQPLGH